MVFKESIRIVVESNSTTNHFLLLHLIGWLIDVRDRFNEDEIDILCQQAGCDILLMRLQFVSSILSSFPGLNLKYFFAFLLSVILS